MLAPSKKDLYLYKRSHVLSKHLALQKKTQKDHHPFIGHQNQLWLVELKQNCHYTALGTPDLRYAENQISYQLYYQRI